MLLLSEDPLMLPARPLLRCPIINLVLAESLLTLLVGLFGSLPSPPGLLCSRLTVNLSTTSKYQRLLCKSSYSISKMKQLVYFKFLIYYFDIQNHFILLFFSAPIPAISLQHIFYSLISII